MGGMALAAPGLDFGLERVPFRFGSAVRLLPARQVLHHLRAQPVGTVDHAILQREVDPGAGEFAVTLVQQFLAFGLGAGFALGQVAGLGFLRLDLVQRGLDLRQPLPSGHHALTTP